MTTIPMKEAAEQVGISMSDLRKIRAEKLTEGLHWVAVGNGQHLTQDGVQALSALLTLQVEETAGLAQPAQPRQAITLHVRRLVRNPRLLMCSVEKDGPPDVRLKVRDASRFRPGMVLDSCFHDHDDVFTFEGKMPRVRVL